MVKIAGLNKSRTEETVWFLFQILYSQLLFHIFQSVLGELLCVSQKILWGNIVHGSYYIHDLLSPLVPVPHIYCIRYVILTVPADITALNSLGPRPNRRHFADDIFKCIFENENDWISPRISLKIVPEVRINNIPASVQIMAWRRPGDKPLSEPMMLSLLTHICVTRPQWVNDGSSPSASILLTTRLQL